jgi:hypothetical protein
VIVKITMLDENLQEFTMMFGDSYKDWQTQYQEFLWQYIQWYDRTIISRCLVFKVISLEACKDRWKAWGGLKWCNESSFQNELNREGCQQNEPDNPKPRQYHKMKFYLDFKLSNFAENLFTERLRHYSKYSSDVGLMRAVIDVDIEKNKLMFKGEVKGESE